MTYQTEIEGMEKGHEYLGGNHTKSFQIYNQALQDVLPVIERAVAAAYQRGVDYAIDNPKFAQIERTNKTLQALTPTHTE